MYRQLEDDFVWKFRWNQILLNETNAKQMVLDYRARTTTQWGDHSLDWSSSKDLERHHHLIII